MNGIRFLRTRRDILASEIAMLALESDPATEDFVMIPKGAVGRLVEEESGLLDMEFDIPDLMGACGCFLAPADLEEVEDNWVGSCGNLKLDPQEQAEAEEWIVLQIFEFPYGDGARPNEETCGDLGRIILEGILRRFRPDLISYGEEGARS